MAVGPFGPWLTGGGSGEPVREPWRVGGAVDEFTPIYLSLARWTDNHGPISPLEVDRMDLLTIAALMGVEAEDEWEREARELRERRARGERVTWDDV